MSRFVLDAHERDSAIPICQADDGLDEICVVQRLSLLALESDRERFSSFD